MSGYHRRNPDYQQPRMDRFALPANTEERELDPELQDELTEKNADRQRDIEQEREADQT